MKVFITWSGDRSKAVALALRDWLPDVIQAAEPWMSSTDIAAGARWSDAISRQLADTHFGIVCLTSTNTLEPWIHFEAGALAKAIDGAYVCPYLLDLEPSGIPQGPLASFQAKRANRDETFQLVQTVNAAMEQGSLMEDTLRRGFDRCWRELESKLEEARALEPVPEQQRGTDDMVREILDLVRALAQRGLMIPAQLARARAQALGFELDGDLSGCGHGGLADPHRSTGLGQQQATPAPAGEDFAPGIPSDQRNPMFG